MTTLPLHFREGHLYLDIGGVMWLLDTGAPKSFGDEASVTMANERFRVERSYLDLTASKLSCFVGVDCGGLLGADVLGRLDFILDTAGGKAVISTGELEFRGTSIHLDEFMGIPIISAQVHNMKCRMFFDTGAQISYYQGKTRTSFPATGRVTDFYPGVGQFETETYNVAITLGGIELTLRCGELPGLLGATLMMAETEGVIGNQVLNQRTIGYFPRRRAIVF